MKTTTHFILTCERAFLTASTNNLNIINIFSVLNTQKFPFSFPQFALVVNFDVDEPGAHTLETRIIGPDKGMLATSRFPLQSSGENLQVIANFENLRFSAPGIHTLDVFLDGQPLGSRQLKVNAVVNPRASGTNFA